MAGERDGWAQRSATSPDVTTLTKLAGRHLAGRDIADAARDADCGFDEARRLRQDQGVAGSPLDSRGVAVSLAAAFAPAAAFALAAAFAVAGCRSDDTGSDSEAVAPASSASAQASKVVQAAQNDDAKPAPSAGPAPTSADDPEVDIPAGTLVAGSMPGDVGRDPVLEPALLSIELGAYSIDRYLFPNDPAAMPITNVTRERAAALCKERERRLCTELEWERACKGPDQQPHAGRTAFDAQCLVKPTGCASGFGVLGMGAHYREWTANDVMPIAKVKEKSAAVRGSAQDAAEVDHRCARRTAVDPGAKSEVMGFRCCGGPPNAATITAPKWLQTFRHIDMPATEVGELFASVPQLSQLEGAPEFFEEPDDVKRVLARAKRKDEPKGFELTTSPLMWNPSPGEEILVLAGKAGKDSFIVAFYKLPDDRYRVGSTLILKNDKGPVVLAHDGSVRRRMRWATCWDCPGEWGKITYRTENRVVITQE